MYEAKASGRDPVLADPALRRSAVERLRLAEEVRDAIAAGEIGVAFQPVVDLRSGEVVAVEALARWIRPGRVLPPSDLVQVAEDVGIIGDLDAYVLRRALAEARHLPPHVVRCTNVSPSELEAPGGVERLLEVVAASGTPASSIRFEITESALSGDVDALVASLHRLRSAGVGLAIDDFGAGHASLTYLARFPVDVLKIDRTFVAMAAQSTSGRAIVEAVVAMASAFGVSVVAEGVEDDQHLAVVLATGCDAAQGFAFGRPGPLVPFAGAPALAS
jgi:EAL domain-containing protein (putative c-di-GMP-specific phosphodiesterase class I)